MLRQFDTATKSHLTKWYAIYTRPNHEKTVAEELWVKQIEVFLPLYQRPSQAQSYRKLLQLPLFPGYLFVRVPLKERRLDILKIKSVVRIVGRGEVPTDIPDEQIQGVKKLVFSTLPIDPYPYIAIGDQVRIIRGPVRGLEGVILEKKNKYRFVVSVDLIMQSVSCEIDAADVEKLQFSHHSGSYSLAP